MRVHMSALLRSLHSVTAWKISEKERQKAPDNKNDTFKINVIL